MGKEPVSSPLLSAEQRGRWRGRGARPSPWKHKVKCTSSSRRGLAQHVRCLLTRPRGEKRAFSCSSRKHFDPVAAAAVRRYANHILHHNKEGLEVVGFFLQDGLSRSQLRGCTNLDGEIIEAPDGWKRFQFDSGTVWSHVTGGRILLRQINL